MRKISILFFLLYLKENMLSDNGASPAMEIKEIINRQNAKFTNQ
jgi:hypothetical protein